MKVNKKMKVKVPRVHVAEKHYSVLQMSLFVLVFGLLGGYLIFRTFAAAPVVSQLEGEAMSPPAGSSVVSDASASGAKALKFIQDGTASATVSLPSQVNSIAITAKGTQCSGSPTVSLKVDGTTLLGATNVASTTYSTYSATVNLSGSHQVSVVAGNLGAVTKGNSGKVRCQRDLSVDLLTFYGPAPVSPPPTVSLSASPLTISSGQSSTLSWSSSNATSCSASGGWSGTKNISGSEPQSPLSTTTYSLTCTGSGGSAKADVTVTVNSISPTPSGSYLFNDEFNGTALDTTKWFNIYQACSMYTNTCRAENVLFPGDGSMHLRTKRDSTALGGFSGALIANFSWAGHPDPNIKVKLAPPFRVESRMLMPNVDGAWPGLWTNDATSPATNSAPLLELDISEERTSDPLNGICHWHIWGTSGVDLNNGGFGTPISNMRTNWHVYWANVYSDHAVIGVDGSTCGNMTFGNYTLPSGAKFRLTSQSFLYQNVIGNPANPGGAWAAGGKQPASTDPGPWDEQVDYIRVTAL